MKRDWKNRLKEAINDPMNTLMNWEGLAANDQSFLGKLLFPSIPYRTSKENEKIMKDAAYDFFVSFIEYEEKNK